MKCDLFLSPGELPDFHAKGRRVVLVDVLRACTSLALAMKGGAERIIPAESVEGAKQLLNALDREYTLLAGEKDGMKLPGFDLGNSPREFLGHPLAGKTIVFTSTNGAQLMTRMFDASEQLLLSFVNLAAVADHVLASPDTELTVVCAGQGGRFSLEDAVCGGMFCEALEKGLEKRKARIHFNDGARAAVLLYRSYRHDLPGLLCVCSHGAWLAENGMGEDLAAAAQVNSVSLVPVVRDGRITAERPPRAEDGAKPGR